MNWLRRFMAGRYGIDPFSIFLLILFLAVNLAASLTKQFAFSPALYILSLLILVYCYFRIFSRNISKRSSENWKFLKFWNPVKAKIFGFFYRIKDSKTHRHFSCPKCRRKLRVPKGKGRIAITCPGCHTEFVKKT